MQEDNLDFSLLVYGGLMKQVYTSTHQLQKWQGLDVLIVYTKKKILTQRFLTAMM